MPTYFEIEQAKLRLKPYLNGYPEPMIDTRRLRKANGTASEKDLREIAAEDHIIRQWKETK